MMTVLKTDEQKHTVKKKFEFPHTLVIIFFMILFVAFLSYVVPAGSFDRIVDSTGRTVVDPDTFHYIDQTPVSILQIFKSIPQGLIAASWIVFLIIVIGGSFGVITSTGAIQAGLSRAMLKLKNKGIILVPITILIFVIFGSTMNMVEATLAFVPLGIMLARALGLDAIVGIGMVTFSTIAGFAAGLYSIYNVGIAQSIAGLPAFSGVGFRAIALVCFYVTTAIYFTRYALKIKKNPEDSVIYEIEKNYKIEVVEEITEFTTRMKIVLIIVVIAFGFVMYASINKWDVKTEFSAIFLMMAVAGGLAAGYSPNKIAEEFLKSARTMLFGALVVGFARGIVEVLTIGNIIDTTVYAMAGLLKGVPKSLAAVSMMGIQTLINCFITSGSGQAAATMPIMSPLGDLLGLTQQTVVLAFQFGDAHTNEILPTSAFLMGSLAFAGVAYSKWVKFIWKLILTNLIVSGILVSIAAAIKLGPF